MPDRWIAQLAWGGEGKEIPSRGAQRKAVGCKLACSCASILRYSSAATTCDGCSRTGEVTGQQCPRALHRAADRAGGAASLEKCSWEGGGARDLTSLLGSHIGAPNRLRVSRPAGGARRDEGLRGRRRGG